MIRNIAVLQMPLLVMLSSLFLACGGDEPAPSTGAWRLVSEGGFVPTPARAVDTSIKDGDFAANCSLIENQATREIDLARLRFVGESPFSLALRDVVTPSNGGSPTDPACRITVIEGLNEYEGACGSGAPTGDVPCQVSGVSYEENGGKGLAVQVRCEGITDIRSGITRDLQGPDGSTFANLSFASCSTN